MFTLLRNGYTWFFPPVCILCHAAADREQDLCTACLNELPILPQSCPRCAKSFLGLTQLLESACGDCLQNPPPFDAAFALFSYVSPITKLIMELKFHERLVNARIFGELLATAVKERWYRGKTLPSVIIPVPLHAKRLQERGFNQALEIARPISKALKIPLSINNCVRIKHTEAQARLALNKRRQNLRNAFSVKSNFDQQHVALLDDVITTGHTCAELAKVLKKAGAARVDVWCCAKTQKH